MALNRLTIINNALLATANSKINALYDGSDEWIVAHNAFDRAVARLGTEKVWDFAKSTETLVKLDDDANASQRFSYAFARPDAAWLIRTVINTTTRAPVPDYELVGNQICCDLDQGIAIEYGRQPSEAETPPWFDDLVTEMVEVHVLRGLNEDFDEAIRRERMVLARIADLRSREDRQTPPRQGYAGTILNARRTRRR